MTREEFNSRASLPVSAEQYQTIEYVYQYHPVIDAVKGKDQIAQLRLCKVGQPDVNRTVLVLFYPFMSLGVE